MTSSEFQKALGFSVNKAIKDGVPLTQVTTIIDMVSFELKFKQMRALEAQNARPFNMEIEGGGDKSGN
jgi:hypothetical protein